MPWSVIPKNPCVINGEDGEYIATAKDAQTASLIAELFKLRGGFSRFDANVDAVIGVTDKALFRGSQQPVNVKLNGWTNKL